MSATVLARIPGLCERQLRGWCRAVFEWRIREPFPGEVAALFDRAKALGIREDSLPMGRGFAKKEAGREAVGSSDPALDTRSCEGASDMPDNRVTVSFPDSASKAASGGAG